MAELKSFTQEEITETHGDMFLYRDLYDGRHSKLFDRAKALIRVKSSTVLNMVMLKHRMSKRHTL
jgi:hypothetical protein